MLKILVAEDDQNIRALVCSSLKSEGYHVVEAFDGKEALRLFKLSAFDIVVSDVMMPNMDGNKLVEGIREINKNIPIIMLTSLDSIDDIELSFNKGADDYLTKPFLLKELSLRIKTLLKRSGKSDKTEIRLSDFLLREETYEVFVNGIEVELSKKLFALLHKLLSNPGKIFTREAIFLEIWGYESDANDRTIDTHISWLRKKVLSNSFEIVTLKGIGYKVVINEIISI